VAVYFRLQIRITMLLPDQQRVADSACVQRKRCSRNVHTGAAAEGDSLVCPQLPVDTRGVAGSPPAHSVVAGGAEPDSQDRMVN
jgi:hypothetical protein